MDDNMDSSSVTAMGRLAGNERPVPLHPRRLRHAARALPVAGLAALFTLAPGVGGTRPAEAAAQTIVSCPGTNLQTAIDNANPGDTLVVRGTCRGNFTIHKNLILVGQHATLDGNNSGTVVTISDATVTISAITVTHGLANNTVVGGDIYHGNGGGIANLGGTVTLNRSPVTANAGVGFSPAGGGIFNNVAANGSGGTLILTSSPVTHNSAIPGVGGGIFNKEGTVTLNSSAVSYNSSFDAGGIDNQNGTLVLNRSEVSYNTATNGLAGGIYNNDGTLRMESSSITGNTTKTSGGGIFGGGSMTLNRSLVNGNTSEFEGGGIVGGGTLTLTATRVLGNRAGAFGGGIANGGTLVMDSSSVSGNTAGTDGGGIWNGLGVATITRSVVVRNAAGNNGGGIWTGCCGGATVTLDRSRVVSNTAANDGGGIFNDDSAVTLLQSLVIANKPNNCAGTSVANCSG